MKRLLKVLSAMVSGVLALALANIPIVQQVDAQQRATATNVPVIPHESVPNFFKLPQGVYTGENMGIATNSRGHIFIFHRSGETRLYEYDEKGVFVKEIGRGNYGFSFAHSVRVDAQDNIWAVDEGTNNFVIAARERERNLLWHFGSLLLAWTGFDVAICGHLLRQIVWCGFLG